MLFIAYIKKGKQVLPIICEDIRKHTLLKGFLVLVNVKRVEDQILPNLKVSEVSIRVEDLIHYVRGHLQ